MSLPFFGGVCQLVSLLNSKLLEITVMKVISLIVGVLALKGQAFSLEMGFEPVWDHRSVG